MQQNYDNSSKLLLFNLTKKNYLIAYVFLFCLFFIGAHRFYTKRYASAWSMLLLGFITIITSVAFYTHPDVSQSDYYSYYTSNIEGAVVIAFLPTVILIIWAIVDIVLTPFYVTHCNITMAKAAGLIEPNTTLTSHIEPESKKKRI